MNPPVIPVDPKGLDALHRTRSWIYLLAIVMTVACVFFGILLAAGTLGLGANPLEAHALMAAGIGGLAAGLPVAYFQFGYAIALSDVAEATGDSLVPAIERACVRQRNLWIATAVVLGVTGLMTLLQTVDLFLL